MPHLSGGAEGVTFEWGAESIIFEFRSLEHSGEMETVLPAQLAIPVCSYASCNPHALFSRKDFSSFEPSMISCSSSL